MSKGEGPSNGCKSKCIKRHKDVNHFAFACLPNISLPPGGGASFASE